MSLKLNVGTFGQLNVARTNSSMILQSAWQRYATDEQNRENILKAWPLLIETMRATGNYKLLGRVNPILKRLKANVIPCNSSWFYAFLLMIEGEEVQGTGYRSQRYVHKR